MLLNSQSKNPWTAAEDRALFDIVNSHGPRRWSFISTLMVNRSAKQCRERWHNHVNPDVKKGHWTVEEDSMIIAMIKKVGFKWAVISAHLPGRTDNAVKNRFNGCLKKLLETSPDRRDHIKEEDDSTGASDDESRDGSPNGALLVPEKVASAQEARRSLDLDDQPILPAKKKVKMSELSASPASFVSSITSSTSPLLALTNMRGTSPNNSVAVPGLRGDSPSRSTPLKRSLTDYELLYAPILSHSVVLESERLPSISSLLERVDSTDASSTASAGLRLANRSTPLSTTAPPAMSPSQILQQRLSFGSHHPTISADLRCSMTVPSTGSSLFTCQPSSVFDGQRPMMQFAPSQFPSGYRQPIALPRHRLYN